MSTILQANAYRQLLKGVQVIRATSNLPQTATGNLFAVSGGRIYLTSIIGEVTTVIQAQANAIKLQSVPTVGSALDLCATVDSNGHAVGTKYGITGTLATAMSAATGGVVDMTNALLIPIGNIALVAAASNTGQVAWTLTYVPLDDGASVAAV